MRREDRQVIIQHEIEEIFKTAVVCRLGLYDGEKTYIVPMNFGYSNNTLYFHSSPEGRKIDILLDHPVVCFEIDIHGDVKNSDTACGWSIDYQSVMGEGRVIFLDAMDEKMSALNVIMDHYSGQIDWDFSDKILKKTSVFKLNIDVISAKRSK